MKRTNNFTLAALALLSLAGCTQDDERTAAGLPMTGTPMRVVAHVDAPMTREAMTTADLTRYYFRVTNQEGADEYDYFGAIEKSGDQWTATDLGINWGSTYPVVSALEQKGVEWTKKDYTTGKEVSVQADQSDRENGLLKSDLLYMAPKTLTPADLDAEGNIKVNLAHRFAKLKVVVTVTGTFTNPITALTIGGTQTTATFIPETDELEVSGNATDIKAHLESPATISETTPGLTATYECILLPQTVAATTLKITATTTTDQKDKEYLHSAPLTLKGNYEYTLRLEMKANGSMSTSGSVGVGGWGEGTGTEEGGELEEGAITSEDDEGKITYTVSTARGLLEWAKAVQSASTNTFPNLTLTDDIDMKGKTWPVIERYENATIDGGRHTIKNLALTEKSSSNGVGLIADGATNCAIKNLTLQNPSITTDEGSGSGGFFAGSMAICTMENCHVIGGTTNLYSNKGGLTRRASASSFTACSVTSSGVAMIEYISPGIASEITACYVTGGKLVVDESSTPTYTASYYQESAGGIMDAEGNTVADWNAAAEKMNEALENTSYQWVENEEDDKADRPLVIEIQTTD
ncbi:MAG TPA: fimbrillin family protein [Candidatus Bacteroides pullicola]|uniref:Fimbrillin family protein n=1 Tax=Candidatus Bacteroides pullicola TaxID=2838475 RepID=A0A9D1ZJF7_9BACE|nr:fimbrillin family protein [Candidatus Bacteroides pullicola]